MDILTPQQRSSTMSRIRGKNTKPELVVRRAAHAMGFRFRLHRSDLPGSPDLTFPWRRKVIFVNGCFWHRHAGCRYAYVPKSNVDFWTAKFSANVSRDQATKEELKRTGWAVLVVWECQISDASALERRLFLYLVKIDRRREADAGR